MKIDRYDMVLANAASNEKSQPVLTQICFRDGKLAATNGLMLVVRNADVEPDDGFTGEQVLIPAKMAKQVKPTAKKPAKLTIKDKEITATYYGEQGEEVDSLQFKADMDVEFPKFEQLFPKGKKHHQHAISISLLRQLLACLPRNGTLRMGFGEKESDPVEFVVTDLIDQAYDTERPIHGCLMPMYVQWDENGNEWQRANEEAVIKKSKERG